MADKKRKVIVYLYNRFADPVIQSNIYLYINSIAESGYNNYDFAIVTYEDLSKLPPPAELEKMKQDLIRKNIHWHYVEWHKGKNLFLKFYDLFLGLLLVLKLRLNGYKHIISLGTISGNFAYLYSLLFGLKLYLYQYEPHSEYGLDSGMWSEDSFKFKIQHWLERKSANFATVISSGTRHMMERLKNWNVKGSVFKIPSVVNEERFIFSVTSRNRIRDKLGITNEKKVFIYPGKFGDLYYYDETAVLFKTLQDAHKDIIILVITPNPVAEMDAMFARYNVDRSRLILMSSVEYSEMASYLSAADFAIIAVPAGPSKKFVSNIKVGEYLCTGLPYIITKGVSEDDWYAEEYNVGAVVTGFSKDEIMVAYPKIEALLNEPYLEVKKRCREIGLGYRSFGKLRQVFIQAIDTLTTK